jgi:Flp pilus assembly protein TadB
MYRATTQEGTKMPYEELMIIFGLLAVVGVGIMVIRLMSMPIVVAAVVGILGWLAFLNQLGLDKV